MNEEIDESEFFHQDFTTASDWELFISRLEEKIHEWQKADVTSTFTEVPQHPLGTWWVQSENIHFVDTEFSFSYHIDKNHVNNQSEEEVHNNGKSKVPINFDYDFVLDNGTELKSEYNIPLWYGLKQFFVLSPVKNEGITSESKIKILLSSLNIALSNTVCEVPAFVQIREKWQKCYLGIHETDNIKTNFEMIHLQKGPQHCQYLTGLLDLFKTKIMSPISLDPVVISVRFTYNINNFGSLEWKQESSDSDHLDIASLSSLPFGVSFEPLSKLVVKCLWYNLQEHLIVDSENYSDFDPLQAQKCTVKCEFSQSEVCLLSECLSEFLGLMNNNATVQDILGDSVVSVESESGANPSDLLTESKVPTISSVLKRAARNSLTNTRRKASSAPITEDVLVAVLYYLFPDAEEESTFPYNDQRVKLTEETDFEKQCKGFKTCNMGSLVSRLGVILAHVLNNFGGIRAMAHLWFEFVQEMRYRWEKSVLIPGLAPGFPDPRTCLLHQKLQMLNCCIERKKARELREQGGVGNFEQALDKTESNNSPTSTDEEEFFDCTDEREQSLWNRPVGRLGKFGSLKLIKTGDPLYIPVTQEPVPKTEDQLEEDADVLLKLGSDAQGSELRAKMMSASLLSDMESFKAANPGSILEDFIRWYSPRDFVEEDELDEWGQKKGHLSSRMTITDNTWVQVWESAKPVPANRQKRLFDDTREAEKVLHFLDSRKVSQIVELLLPVVAHAALSRLHEELVQVIQELPDAVTTLRHCIKLFEKISREGIINLRRYEALFKNFTELELKISQTNSLLYKLNPSGEKDEGLGTLVSNLVEGKEVEIVEKWSSKIGSQILQIFIEERNSANIVGCDFEGSAGVKGDVVALPRPQEREFVMKVLAARPATYSAKSLQFLRAILSKNEFRVVATFSEDIVFF